jgi:hypothetical protein
VRVGNSDRNIAVAKWDVMNWLGEHDNWLVVFDALEDIDSIAATSSIYLLNYWTCVCVADSDECFVINVLLTCI